MSRFHSYRLIEEMTDAPLTIESFLDSRLAQRSILEQINATADLLTNTPEEDTEDEDWVDCFIHTPLLSVALYDYLIEEERLPKFSSGGKRIVYQLTSNRLGIEIVPSLCHDNAAMAITSDLLRWAESGGVQECLENGGGGGTTVLNLSLTSLDWLYNGTSKKSPDNSFTPANVTSPPGKYIGTTNVLYPNFAVEVGKSHESWDRLLRDCEEKHFAAMTGVVLYLGIKIYPTGQIRVCLLERDFIRGHGYAFPPLGETGFVDISVPCNDTIVVPKRLIFYGDPEPPPTITPDYILPIELIRRRVCKYWEA
jgi:hypothetical protein